MRAGSKLVALAFGAVISVALPLQAQTPVKGGPLTYSFHPEPTAMSAIVTTAMPVALVATKMCQSLLQWEGAEMKPMPGLAESGAGARTERPGPSSCAPA